MENNLIGSNAYIGSCRTTCAECAGLEIIAASASAPLPSFTRVEVKGLEEESFSGQGAWVLNVHLSPNMEESQRLCPGNCSSQSWWKKFEEVLLRWGMDQSEMGPEHPASPLTAMSYYSLLIPEYLLVQPWLLGYQPEQQGVEKEVKEV